MNRSSRVTRSDQEPIRQRIADEAARLLARGKVRNFHVARMRAMRWLSQQRLRSSDVPSQEEVMQSLERLVCSEQQQADAICDPHRQVVADESAQTQSWSMQFRPLLERLEDYRWPTDVHPEENGLYHSLQVYVLGCGLSPYDLEFQWACLLHDIGVVVDPRVPQEAAVRVLAGRVTDRVEYLIGQLAVAHDYLNGLRRNRSVRRDESFPELLDLARCDRDGRVPGADVPTLDEAFMELETLESQLL